MKIKGEPVYVCRNGDAYYGTMPFNLKESEDVIDTSDDEITYKKKLLKIMNKMQKKALYENIMRSVSKTIKNV